MNGMLPGPGRIIAGESEEVVVWVGNTGKVRSFKILTLVHLPGEAPLAGCAGPDGGMEAAARCSGL